MHYVVMSHIHWITPGGATICSFILQLQLHLVCSQIMASPVMLLSTHLTAKAFVLDLIIRGWGNPCLATRYGELLMYNSQIQCCVFLNLICNIGLSFCIFMLYYFGIKVSFYVYIMLRWKCLYFHTYYVGVKVCIFT